MSCNVTPRGEADPELCTVCSPYMNKLRQSLSPYCSREFLLLTKIARLSSAAHFIEMLDFEKHKHRIPFPSSMKYHEP